MRIFLSYAREDAATARAIARELGDTGHQVWMDKQAIQAGDRWRKEVARGIRGAEMFVILLSRHAVASETVAKELEVADEFRKRIIPLRRDRTRIPEAMLLILSGLHYIDLPRGWSADGTIASRLGLAEPGRPGTMRPRQARSRKPHVIQTELVTATPVQLFRVAADVESYPQWHSGVRKVRVLERNGDGFASRVEWGVGLKIVAWIEIKYVLQYTYDYPRLISWECCEPSMLFDEMWGSYEFIPSKSRHTQVVCSLGLESRIVPRLGQLKSLITSTRLDDLKARAEEVASRKAG